MPTCRKAEDSDLVRIDVPLRRVRTHQSHGPLRVFQRHRRFRIRPRFRIGPHIRHAILQQYTRDSLGRQPVTDFCAFKIDGQNLIAPTGEEDDRDAVILSLGSIYHPRGPRHAAHTNHLPACYQKLISRRLHNLRTPDWLWIRRCNRPYGDLHMPGDGSQPASAQPDCRAQTQRSNTSSESLGSWVTNHVILPNLGRPRSGGIGPVNDIRLIRSQTQERH
jgi:hypothetical protein